MTVTLRELALSQDRGTVPPVTTAPGQVQTTIWLPRPMHEQLRKAAFNGRLTQSAIMRAALEEWLRGHPDTGPGEKA